MTERAYTVNEVDALRRAVENKWLFGSYGQQMGNCQSRSYHETDKTQCVEHIVRTWMVAGKTAQDLYESERPSATVWPTPTARDWKSPGTREGYLARIERGYSQPLPEEVGGPLNPTWVEWLMGFPEKWTDLEHSATPSSPKSSTNLAEPSCLPANS